MSRASEVHLVGCLGNGMRELARLLTGLGMAVSGCDARSDDPAAASAVRRLRSWGVEIASADDHLGTAMAQVVHTAAAPRDHPDLRAARVLRIPVRSRVEALAALLPRLADDVIAIGGVTGKSTIAVLLAQLLEQCGRNPSLYVGAQAPGLTDRPRPAGRDRLAVVEACEVFRAMNALPRTIAVISSVFWGEHPGSYPTPSSLESAFAEFAGGASRVVLPEAHRRLAAGRPAVTFGTTTDADVQVCAYQARPEGFSVEFDVLGARVSTSTAMFGRHNADNLAAAVATLLTLGVLPERISQLDFASLRPPQRRIEQVAFRDGTTVYDDFGHNPVQIGAAHQALRERHPQGRLGAFFQPTGFGRLHAFRHEYVRALQVFDQVVVAPPHRSFEDPESVDDETRFADWLVERLRDHGVEAQIGPAAPNMVKLVADGCTAACVFSILPSPLMDPDGGA